MALPFALIASVFGVGGGLYLLAGIVSHLIEPISLFAGGVVALLVLGYLDRQGVLEPLGSDRVVTVANAGVALFFGFVAYKAAVWILAGVAVTTAFLLIIAVLVLGLPAVIALMQVAVSRYISVS